MIRASSSTKAFGHYSALNVWLWYIHFAGRPGNLPKQNPGHDHRKQSSAHRQHQRPQEAKRGSCCKVTPWDISALTIVISFLDCLKLVSLESIQFLFFIRLTRFRKVGRQYVNDVILVTSECQFHCSVSWLEKKKKSSHLRLSSFDCRLAAIDHCVCFF